jgi:hypothetical protein
VEDIFFSTHDGSAQTVSRIELIVPQKVPNVEPSQARHALTIIMDTSGSTSMSSNGMTFLERCKGFLVGILEALPLHLNMLRSKHAINGQPVVLRLWEFNSRLSEHLELELQGGIHGPAAAREVLEAAISKTKTLKSAGCTNFDNWARRLRSVVAENAGDAHHVLLLTDGGATQQASFQADIASIQDAAGLNFLQVQLHD